jgi:mono/diheme cytochrome c family protein
MIDMRKYLWVVLFVLSSAAAFAMQDTSANGRQPMSGAELFEQTGCSHCHGPQGVGGGKGPDLSEVGKRLKADAIAHQIHDGGKSMPAFGEVLSDEQIHSLVEYLRTKRFVERTEPTSKPNEAKP